MTDRLPDGDTNIDESETEASSPASFLGGLVLGLLAGVAVAMVAAPHSGEETRDLLRAKLQEVADRTRGTADDVSQNVSGTADDLLERGRSIVDAARARVDASIADGKDAAELHRSELFTELNREV